MLHGFSSELNLCDLVPVQPVVFINCDFYYKYLLPFLEQVSSLCIFLMFQSLQSLSGHCEVLALRTVFAGFRGNLFLQFTSNRQIWLDHFSHCILTMVFSLHSPVSIYLVSHFLRNSAVKQFHVSATINVKHRQGMCAASPQAILSILLLLLCF